MEVPNVVLSTSEDVEVHSRVDDNPNKKQRSEMEVEMMGDVEIVSRFSQMGMRKELLDQISMFGFEEPSAIHQRALMPIIAGRDAIVQAQPGAEKTLIIALAVCQRISTVTPAVQAVIVSPTPELAIELFRKMGDNLDVKACICDGTNGEDMVNLPGVHVVFGTPDAILLMMTGRTLRGTSGTLTSGTLGTHAVKLLILDASDEMLNKGFLEKICVVYDRLPRRFQVVLLSATLPPEILTMGDSLTTCPVRIRDPAAYPLRIPGPAAAGSLKAKQGNQSPVSSLSDHPRRSMYMDKAIDIYIHETLRCD